MNSKSINLKIINNNITIRWVNPLLNIDMSHKLVKIIDITRFRWQGLIKLNLKSSFLCNEDWMVIVDNACSFPHLE